MSGPSVANRGNISNFTRTPMEVAVTTALTGALIGATPAYPLTYMLNGATAGAYTLAAPATDGSADGCILRLVAGTAAAHVVTATGLINDGVTGGAKTTMTFGAFLGSSITLTAYNGAWYVLAKNVVTIT